MKRPPIRSRSTASDYKQRIDNNNKIDVIKVCPHAASFMTLCYLNDGDAALVRGICVGCKRKKP